MIPLVEKFELNELTRIIRIKISEILVQESSFLNCYIVNRFINKVFS